MFTITFTFQVTPCPVILLEESEVNKTTLTSFCLARRS